MIFFKDKDIEFTNTHNKNRYIGTVKDVADGFVYVTDMKPTEPGKRIKPEMEALWFNIKNIDFIRVIEA